MPKYYYSKTNTTQDEQEALGVWNTGEGHDNRGYGIIMNSSQVRFFKDGQHKANLNKSGGPTMPTKSGLSSLLGEGFNKFFSGDAPAGTSNTNNAIAYLNANKNGLFPGI